MEISHRQRMVFLWLVLSVLVGVFVYSISLNHVRNTVSRHLQDHLVEALDETHFSSAQNRLTDGSALQRLGSQINLALADVISTRWYAPVRACSVEIIQIDGIQISAINSEQTVKFQLPRNQIQREIEVAVSCSPKPLLTILCAGLLGLLFWGISHLFPPPLSSLHRYWIGYLTGRGYSWDSARELLREYGEVGPTLNPIQLAALEQIHQQNPDNFAWALRSLGHPRAAKLNEHQMRWLLLGLKRDPDDLERALLFAEAPDSLDIDLPHMRLSIRGEAVEMGGTPLFYYAWYALGRCQDEGWLTNPASNRPDLGAGQALAALMERHGGHGRAINDLEAAGLKAKTLDQNRSKIKDELVSALGEDLAANYLFEGGRLPDGNHMRYRLQLPASQIELKI